MKLEDLPRPMQDWLQELEGFHLRIERLFEEAQSDMKDRPARVLEWLQVAYELGQRNPCSALPAAAERHGETLARCPLCGADEGYRLADGSTFRWWSVQCASCGQELGECRSDKEAPIGAPMPARWPAADSVWNAAGAYARSLRAALSSLPGGEELLAGIDQGK